jgi:5'-nucleotidase
VKRRQFITKTAAAGAFISLGSPVLLSGKPSKEVQITLLHTNDVHSHIDPFPATHARNPNMGGVARRATLINQIRKENPNTLLLDAGDIFQGTPYFNFYGGELEFKLMSLMQYDASTIGNHDFDNGIDGLLAQLPHAKFDFLSANYDFTNTVLDSFVKPYKTYVKEGIKIGVFGLGIELDGLVNKDLYKETQYLNPIEMAQETTHILKFDESCDLIVCLSHLGYDYDRNRKKIGDLELAEKTEHIDLIIGGHTHTFLDKPTVTQNKNGDPVLVNQVGCYGINLGRVDFYFESDSKKTGDGISIKV